MRDSTTNLTSMDRENIRAAINEYLNILEQGRGDEQQNVRALELALDRLALAVHFVNADFEDGYSDPPTQEYNRLRKLAVKQFPSFGLYNMPSRVTTQTADIELHIGDALDDIADIARDLLDVSWCWEHTSEKDALWHFRFEYETHWGEHLRCLQWYLYRFRLGM